MMSEALRQVDVLNQLADKYNKEMVKIRKGMEVLEPACKLIALRETEIGELEKQKMELDKRIKELAITAVESKYKEDYAGMKRKYTDNEQWHNDAVEKLAALQVIMQGFEKFKAEIGMAETVTKGEPDGTTVEQLEKELAEVPQGPRYEPIRQQIRQQIAQAKESTVTCGNTNRMLLRIQLARDLYRLFKLHSTDRMIHCGGEYNPYTQGSDPTFSTILLLEGWSIPAMTDDVKIAIVIKHYKSFTLVEEIKAIYRGFGAKFYTQTNADAYNIIRQFNTEGTKVIELTYVPHYELYIRMLEETLIEYAHSQF
jgi:hypothetical protein